MDDLNKCFACGKENPIGLQLDFQSDGGRVKASFTPEELHQGYQGIMHGGLVSTLLDEAMAKIMNFRGIKAVTATLEVKFRHPVVIGEPITVWGEIVEERRRRYKNKSWITDAQGKILAEASSVFIKL